MNGAVTAAAVTSVSLTEVKMERDQFLMVSLKLAAESKPPQMQDNSAISKTAAFAPFTFHTDLVWAYKDSTFFNLRP